MNLSLSRQLCVLLAISSVCLAEDFEIELEKGGAEQKCNGEVVALNTTTGSIILPASRNGTVCVWSFPAEKSDPFIFVDSWQLDAADSVVISTSENETLYNVTGSVNGTGFVFLKKDATIVVSLKISNATTAFRSLHLKFNAKDAEAAPITVNGLTRLQIPLLSRNDTFKGDVKIHLDSTLGVNSVVAVTWDKFDKAASLTYTNAKGPQSPASDSSIDDTIQDNPSKDLVLDIKNIPLGQVGSIVISVDVVDNRCSDYITKGTNSLSTPSSPDDSLSCLWLINLSDTKQVQLDYNQVLFFGAADVLTIRDGLNGYTAPVIVQARQDNLAELKKSLNSQLVGNQLRISYVSRYISDDEQKLVSTLNYKAVKGGSLFVGPNDTVQFDLSGNGNIFAFTTSSDKKAALALKDGKAAASGTTLAFYNSLDLSAAPLFTVEPKQFIPDIVTSDTNILRVTVLSDGTGLSGKFTSENNNYKTLLGQNDAVTVDGTLGCSDKASALVPARVGNGTYTLSLSKLQLSIDGDCLSVKQYAAAEGDLLSYCFKKDDLMVKTTAFPQLIVPSNYGYVVTYTRGKDCRTPAAELTLLDLSVSYSPSFDCRTIVQLTPTANSTLAPTSYPGPFPLIHDDLVKASAPTHYCGFIANNTGKVVYTVFRDLELLSKQTLSVKNPDQSLAYNSNNTELPGDAIGQNIMFYDLVSVLSEKTVLSNNQAVSGRGFKIDLVSADCGGYVDGTKVANLTTPDFPKATANVSKCIWIVDLKTAGAINKHPLINFTLTYDKSNADVVVYDNPTIRDGNRVVNMSAPVNGTFSSSVETVIVVLTVKDPKKGTSLAMNWNFQTCEQFYPGLVPRFCGDMHRCILPQWICNNQTECGDYSDEFHCNGSLPLPPTPDCPKSSGGVSGWVIVLVIIPMAIIVGGVLSIFGPVLLTKFRNGRYQEFRDFSEVS